MKGMLIKEGGTRHTGNFNTLSRLMLPRLTSHAKHLATSHLVKIHNNKLLDQNLVAKPKSMRKQASTQFVCFVNLKILERCSV
ncbi:MAG: hypothetical protein C3F13_17015 [Anaerolineales bacterium]|nr:MAG: hypothetical protein C3F13_17015 [Anaerolineales bacterium]